MRSAVASPRTTCRWFERSCATRHNSSIVSQRFWTGSWQARPFECDSRRLGTEIAHVPHEGSIATTDVPARGWRDRRVAVARCDGSSRHRAGPDPGRTAVEGRLHLCAARRGHGVVDPDVGRDAIRAVSNAANPGALQGLNGRRQQPASRGWNGRDARRGRQRLAERRNSKRTEAEDFECGTTIDQVVARKIGQSSPFPSLEFATEDFTGYVGGCTPGYSCAYHDSISWATPTTHCRWRSIHAWRSSACSVMAAPTQCARPCRSRELPGRCAEIQAPVKRAASSVPT